MISLMRRGAILVFAFFAFNTIQAQPGGKVMKIDSIVQLEPIVMLDYTDFAVTISVYDSTLLTPDSIFGDLFYYYLTDSMISAGTPPRVINELVNNIWVYGTVTDTVPIDIQPGEIRTSPPVNLIILWPAITSPDLADSIPDSTYANFDGYIGIPTIPDPKKLSVIFPIPAMQYMYIKPEEIELIKHINILSIEGKLISTHEYLEYKSGFISIDTMPAGTYLVELNYKNGEVIRTKIIKH
jgi:hypothetical protein